MNIWATQAKLIELMTVEHLVVEKELSVSILPDNTPANVPWALRVTLPCSACKVRATHFLTITHIFRKHNRFIRFH